VVPRVAGCVPTDEDRGVEARTRRRDALTSGGVAAAPVVAACTLALARAAPADAGELDAARAATRTWDGPASGEWNTAANWSPDGGAAAK
jgi:hypothetical protein